MPNNHNSFAIINFKETCRLYCGEEDLWEIFRVQEVNIKEFLFVMKRTITFCKYLPFLLQGENGTYKKYKYLRQKIIDNSESHLNGHGKIVFMHSCNFYYFYLSYKN